MWSKCQEEFWEKKGNMLANALGTLSREEDVDFADILDALVESTYSVEGENRLAKFFYDANPKGNAVSLYKDFLLEPRYIRYLTRRYVVGRVFSYDNQRMNIV